MKTRFPEQWFNPRLFGTALSMKNTNKKLTA